jgi:hypothetical protein
VAWPLELNTLEAAAGFVHLKKHHHRNAADQIAGQNYVGVAVPEVEGVRQSFGIPAELLHQRICGFAPMSLLP